MQNTFASSLLIVLALACAVQPAAAAPKILVISDSSVAFGGGDPHDDSLVTFLQDSGYEVDITGMDDAYHDGMNPFGNPAKVDALNLADLVLVSRRTNSGDYDDNRQNWNELGTPLLLMAGHIIRGGGDNRWGWVTGGAGDRSLSATTIEVEAGQVGHPFLAGLSDPFEGFDWSTAPTPGDSPKAVFLPTTPPVTGGTVLATYDTSPILIDYPAGTDFDGGGQTGAGPFGVAGARRVFLGHWGYDIDIDGTPAQFEDFLTDDYKTLLVNILNDLAPTTAFVPGDVNEDNVADMLDFAIIRDNFRMSPAARAEGDLDRDGEVGIGDFREWKDAFNAAGGGVVPEPGSIALLAIGMALASVGGRRREAI